MNVSSLKRPLLCSDLRRKKERVCVYECMGVRLREKERFLNTMAPVNCDPLLRLSCFNDYSMADIEWIGSLTHSLFLSLSHSFKTCKNYFTFYNTKWEKLFEYINVIQLSVDFGLTFLLHLNDLHSATNNAQTRCHSIFKGLQILLVELRNQK